MDSSISYFHISYLWNLYLLKIILVGLLGIFTENWGEIYVFEVILYLLGFKFLEFIFMVCIEK